MMESPSLYRAKIEALKEGKDINSVKIEAPTKKMTPRQKAAYEKAQATYRSERCRKVEEAEGTGRTGMKARSQCAISRV